ncbi:MAG: anti-sigma factor antagonist [Oscillospiraceae bacterium]|jgi:stage II sporulation protein AA (anti-sigma F factor antagonist)|nr:anti-sigma factor antagonist [Oscillospiraceae bacterium]
MPVTIEVKNGEVKAILQGEIDHHNAASMRKNIDESVERLRPKRLKLDFGEVTFMDSSGIGLVMGRYNTMSLIGGDVEINNPSASIEKIFNLSGISKIAKICSDKEE